MERVKSAYHIQHVEAADERVPWRMRLGNNLAGITVACMCMALYLRGGNNLTTSSMLRLRVGGFRGVRASAHSRDASRRDAAIAALCASSSAALAASVPSSLGSEVLCRAGS